MRLIFSRKRSLGSLLIRFFCWSRWSHVSIVESDEFVIDATFQHGGVRHRGLAVLLRESSAHQEVTVDVPDEAAALGFARAQVGRPYDWTALVGHVLRSGRWPDPDAWFCSELVEASLLAGGLMRFRVDASRITPEHSWMVV